MILAVNELLKIRHDNESETLERILWIDKDYELLFTIDVIAKKALPLLRRVEEVSDWLGDGRARRTTKDPHKRLILDKDLTDASRQTRDNAWAIVRRLVGPEREPDIYYSVERGKIINQLLKELDPTYPPAKSPHRSRVFKLVRRYWQRGKDRNALLPDYYHCGKAEYYKDGKTERQIT